MFKIKESRTELLIAERAKLEAGALTRIPILPQERIGLL
jgi:hypothetical protein